jgi:dihydrofolate reductase
MGAATYNSMKSYYKDKPLPFRTVYVADINNNKYEDAITVPDVHVFIKDYDNKIYVIGGASIYKLLLPYADELYITHIDAEHEGDVYMQRFDLEGDFDLVSSTEFDIFRFNKYERKG